MPNPIYLSNFQLDYIRAQLQRISSRTIVDANDCKFLVKYLQDNHKTYLSESTLKRLFGIVTSPNSASLFTLNLISKVLGYEDWSKLNLSLLGNNFEEINHVLLQNATTEYLITPTSFLKSEKLILNSWVEAYQYYIFKLVEKGFLITDRDKFEQNYSYKTMVHNEPNNTEFKIQGNLNEPFYTILLIKIFLLSTTNTLKSNATS